MSHTIILGNGPSSWGIYPLDVLRLRLAGFEVATCNHRELPSDVVFIHDRPMLRKIRLLPWQRLATFESFLKDDGPTRRRPRERVWLMPPGAEGHYSCGGMAICAYVAAGAEQLDLVGFDGRLDLRTIPGCRGANIHAYDAWHLRVVEYVRNQLNWAGRMRLVVSGTDRHPLDAIAAERIAPDEWQREVLRGEPAADPAGVGVPDRRERA